MSGGGQRLNPITCGVEAADTAASRKLPPAKLMMENLSVPGVADHAVGAFGWRATLASYWMLKIER